MSNKRYFDDVAKQWDTMREGFFSEDVRKKAYEVAEVQTGKLAADIGAGTGFITEGLLAKGVKVIAVDQSDAMLAEMRSKFKSIRDIQYRAGDATSLPIDDHKVDYVFANMFLHHVEKPGAVIKEMVRVLKPSGRLIITDLDCHDYDFLVTEQKDRWKGFNREDIKKWYREAGLKSVNVDCVGANCCSDSKEGKQKAEISVFVAWGEK